MRVLVTGGAGFIGANYTKKMLSDGHDVLVIDALTYAGNPKTVEEFESSDRFRFEKADITDTARVTDIFRKFLPQQITHFAAESHVSRSELNPDIFYQTNVQGTKNLLETALATAPTARFIHISTDEVYGEIEDGFFAEEDKLPGDSQATSGYAKSKALADDLALAFADKLDVIVARPTNNFGPYQYPEKYFPRALTSISTGRNIKVWDGGEQVRDWLYASDTANAVALLFERGKRGEAYNIGANNEPEISNLDLAKWILQKMGVDDERLEFVGGGRSHHDLRYGVRTDKIRALGWTLSRDPWQNFDETYNWYIANEEWWMPLIKEAESIYRGN